MAEFFSMGGYAFYVWSSYGLAALTLGGLTWFSFATAHARRKELEMIEKMKPFRCLNVFTQKLVQARG